MGNGWLEITHAGLKEVERARERPGLATEHFEPGVIYNFHGPVGAVQTGPGATAQVVQNFGPEQQKERLRASPA